LLSVILSSNKIKMSKCLFNAARSFSDWIFNLTKGAQIGKLNIFGGKKSDIRILTNLQKVNEKRTLKSAWSCITGNFKDKNIVIVICCITRLENVILQVQARFVEQRHQPRPTNASTCKTFSSRVIHKKFSADNLFKDELE
jgi:hypothetical protein